MAERATHLTTSSGAPESCDAASVGRIYFDTAMGQSRVCGDAGWASMGGGTVGQPPAGLGLDAVTGATPDAPVTSNALTLQTANAVSAVLTGGNGLPFATLVRNGSDTGDTSAVYQPGDTLAVRMTAADTYLTSRVVLAYVGGVTTDWSVTTKADLDPDSFAFDDVLTAPLSTTVTSNTVTLADFTGDLTFSVTGGATVQLNGSDTGVSSAQVTAGDTVALVYDTPSGFDESTTFGISLSTFSTSWTVTNRGECTPGNQAYGNPGQYTLDITADLLGCIFIVEAYGAGGAGGGSGGGYQSAGGGGGGGYARGRLTFDAPEEVAITVGTGGQVNNSGSGTGGHGGASTFGTWVSASGGLGAPNINQNYTGGPGGAGAGGIVQNGATLEFTSSGGNGAYGNSNPHISGGGGGGAGPDGNGASASGASGGAGGGGMAGRGGNGGQYGAEPGERYGGGGSGEHHGPTDGNGAHGWLIVRWE